MFPRVGRVSTSHIQTRSLLGIHRRAGLERHRTCRSRTTHALILGPSSAVPVRASSTGFLPCIGHGQRRHFADAGNSTDALVETCDLPPADAEVAELTESHVGKTITLHGYLGVRSDVTKTLSFAPLLSPDLAYSVQLISSTKSQDNDAVSVHTALKTIRPNVPVVVKGIVQSKVKPKDAPRHSEVKKNESVEVKVVRITPLNSFPESLVLKEETNIPPEQRHLQIRQSRALRDALAFRANAMKACRDYLHQGKSFVEIETPLLFKSTPEGAREFLVPTRTQGQAYALPQSPQQYKQVLMASGIPRYFQFARCFRDEDLRADRQPEFTQLDLEMAFAVGADVMTCIEGLVLHLWKEMLGQNLAGGPFQRMSYSDAMSTYGSDKPDTRLGMEIRRTEHLLPVDLISKIGPLHDPAVEVFKLALSGEPADTRKFVASFMDSPVAKPFLENPEGQPGIFIFDPRKPLGGLQPFGFEAAEQLEEILALEEGDLVVLQARRKQPFSGGSTPIGNLRLALHRHAVSLDLIEPPSGWHFLWVTEFPLFSPVNDVDPGQGGSAGLASTHHPFTAPASSADIHLLASDPASATAEHYDLVLNGVELGGGSRRIHDARLQRYVLTDVLKMTDERLKDFEHLLNVLSAGCPPHAGIALGFDRLMATMLGKESIRDVIAFPKSGKGEDLLVKSPSPMTKSQLDTYHLQLKT